MEYRGRGGGFAQSDAATKHPTLGNEDVYSAEGLASGEPRGVGTTTAWWRAVQGGAADAPAWISLPSVPSMSDSLLDFLFQCWGQTPGSHICLGKCWNTELRSHHVLYLKLTDAITDSAHDLS